MVREDLLIKQEREALSKERKRVLNELRELKTLRTRYEEVIDDLRFTLKWWKTNKWKATFLSIVNRFKKGGDKT
jgi:hypothetical protein